MFKYHATFYGKPAITKVPYIRETKAIVWLTSEWKQKKLMKNEGYFRTVREAKDFLLGRAIEEVEMAKKRLGSATLVYFHATNVEVTDS